jgi:hypothetical protein
LVQASAGLARCGFRAPCFSAEWLAKHQPPWEVRVSVRTGEDGRVTHVFLEEPCGHEDVNAMVVRRLHEATVAGEGPAVTGFVMVSYGMQPTAEAVRQEDD